MVDARDLKSLGLLPVPVRVRPRAPQQRLELQEIKPRICEFNMEEEWMRTDECLDVISSLELFIYTFGKLNTDGHYLKWSIISLHSALQGMMAFHLSFGNNLLVMTEKDAEACRKDTEAWLKANHNQTTYPETKMDRFPRMVSFPNLYEKIKKHEVSGYKFTPQGQQEASVKKLNGFRNGFIHFMPSGCSNRLSSMLGIFLDCLNIIKSLGNAAPSRWEDDCQYEEFSYLIESAIQSVNEQKNN